MYEAAWLTVRDATHDTDVVPYLCLHPTRGVSQVSDRELSKTFARDNLWGLLSYE